MEFHEWLKEYRERPDREPKKKKKTKTPKKRVRKLKKGSAGMMYVHAETGEEFYGKKAATLRIGCSDAMLNNYERRGIIPKPLRTANNYRIYSERQVVMIRRLALKRLRRHRDAEEYGAYVIDTWYLKDDGTPYEERIDAV